MAEDDAEDDASQDKTWYWRLVANGQNLWGEGYQKEDNPIDVMSSLGRNERSSFWDVVRRKRAG